MTGPLSNPWTLAFELSNPTSGQADASSIALGRGGTVIATERVAPAAPRSAEDDLFPAIQRLFARAGVTTKDLRGGRIAVSVGPGGYTGLRVACAAANTLAESVGARCVSVPTALVALRGLGAAERARVPAGKKVAVALASKSDSAWVCVQGDEAAAAGHVVAAAGFAGWLAERGVALLIADSFLPGAMREACAAGGVEVAAPSLSAAACLEVSAGLEAIDPAGLVPVYAREPDAVTLWRNRKT